MGLLLSGCIGVASTGLFGTGVSVAFDPRTVGTQIDDNIMEKSLKTKILLRDKNHLLKVKVEVLEVEYF